MSPAIGRNEWAQDVRAMQKPSGSFVGIAQDCGLAGEGDLAFQSLQKSIEAREGQKLTLLAVDPCGITSTAIPGTRVSFLTSGCPMWFLVQHQN